MVSFKTEEFTYPFGKWTSSLAVPFALYILAYLGVFHHDANKYGLILLIALSVAAWSIVVYSFRKLIRSYLGFHTLRVNQEALWAKSGKGRELIILWRTDVSVEENDRGLIVSSVDGTVLKVWKELKDYSRFKQLVKQFANEQG